MSLTHQLHKDKSTEEYQRIQIAAFIFDKHARNWWLKNAPTVSEFEFHKIRKEVNQ